MTAPAFSPYAPYRPLTATEKAADRWGLTLARRALRREFPGVAARQRVDQALAATERTPR